MKRLRSKGLAVALLAAALSVLGVGTSAAHSPADQQKFAAQPREGGDDPVSKIACTLQMKQGECQSKPGGGEGGGSGGGSGGSPSHPPHS